MCQPAKLQHAYCPQRTPPKMHPSADEQIRRALTVSAKALQLHMMCNRSDDSSDGVHDVSKMADILCEHVQMPNYKLLRTLIVRYFMHLGIARATIQEFAQELSSLVWALCYATPEHLLAYVVEVYSDSNYNHQTVSEEMCITIIQNMYSFFQQPFEDVVQQLQEYVIALENCSAPSNEAVIRPTLACSCSVSSTDGSVCSDGEDGNDVASVPATRPKPRRPSGHRFSLPPLRLKRNQRENKATDACVANQPSHRPELRQCTTPETADESEFSCVTTTSCDRRSSRGHALREWNDKSPNSLCVPRAIPTRALLSFYKLRSSKFWPLITLQARLRAVYFGADYWNQATTFKSDILDFDESIFLFVVDLRSLYLPARVIPGFLFGDEEEQLKQLARTWPWSRDRSLSDTSVSTPDRPKENPKLLRRYPRHSFRNLIASINASRGKGSST